MIEIRIATKAELKEVSALSFEFQNEGSCYGLIGDTLDHYTMDVYIALVDNKIVGYAYGTFYDAEKDNSFFKKGEKIFSFDEIYVNKDYRNLGIGSKLFKAVEAYAKEKGATKIDLSTASKDYHKALNFYINMMGLEYWAARLVKDIK
ncbi:MAG: GNAT family N-acetyltransferase [Acholeplasmatales bacterium]|nr:GNAT family N-acetyltransferase [Acholeplasmatales bacterium]